LNLRRLGGVTDPACAVINPTVLNSRYC